MDLDQQSLASSRIMGTNSMQRRYLRGADRSFAVVYSADKMEKR